MISPSITYYEQSTENDEGFDIDRMLRAELNTSFNVKYRLGDMRRYIGFNAYIGKNVVIGNNVKIYPNSFIGDNVTIGNDCIFFAGVRIYSETEIGNNCTIHSGTIIGSDGFGFAPQQDGTFKKVPQIGNVIIENDVEIGAATFAERNPVVDAHRDGNGSGGAGDIGK